MTTDLNKSNYLEVSKFEADDGFLIGKSPSEIPKPALEVLGHPQSPIKAIRAKCVDCCGGNSKEVRKCVAFNCPLWPFRMTKNPFHKKAKVKLKP